MNNCPGSPDCGVLLYSLEQIQHSQERIEDRLERLEERLLEQERASMKERFKLLALAAVAGGGGAASSPLIHKLLSIFS